MDRGGRICTVPSSDGRKWWNIHDGRVLSRHVRKEAAVEAGREIAQRLGVPHLVQESQLLLEEGSCRRT